MKGPGRIGCGGTTIAADPDEDPEVFLSFGAEVDGAILQKNTSVSALGRVGRGVTLRSGFMVLPGKNVTTQAQADDPALGKVRLVTEADVAFAREYSKLARENPSALRGAYVDAGNTSFNPSRDLPSFAGVEQAQPEFRNRIIGGPGSAGHPEPDVIVAATAGQVGFRVRAVVGEDRVSAWSPPIYVGTPSPAGT